VLRLKEPRSELLGRKPIASYFMPKQKDDEFSKLANEESRTGLIREFWDVLRETKKWWLLPILIVFFIFGLLILLSGTGLAPFIYTLF